MARKSEESPPNATQELLLAIGNWSLQELLVFKTELRALISQRQKETRTALRGHLLAMAQMGGLVRVNTLLYAGQTDSAGKGAPIPPKYRDPTNRALTWSGRGRKPGWVMAHLDAGGQMADLEER